MIADLMPPGSPRKRPDGSVVKKFQLIAPRPFWSR